MEWEGSRCWRCKRYTNWMILLNATDLQCSRGENLSNNIKANKYRTRLYATYTTLDTDARTMFVHFSQE